MVIGLGILLLGLPPGARGDGAQLRVHAGVTIVYAGVWLAVALLFSIVFRSAATAALVTLGLWLFLTFIWPVLAGASRRSSSGPDRATSALGLQRQAPRI